MQHSLIGEDQIEAAKLLVNQQQAAMLAR